MNDREAEQVRSCVEDFLRQAGAAGLDVGRPEHFEKLVAHVQRGGALTSETAEDELRMVAAMCWLGPRTPVPPPQSMREELFQIIQRILIEPAQRPERITEFVIAYGCGKWRRVQHDADGWLQRWPGAMHGLQRALEPIVNEADRWLALRARVVSYPQRSRDELAEDAWILTLRLIHAEKPLQLSCQQLSLKCADDGLQLEAPDYSELIPTGAKAVFSVSREEAALRVPDEGEFRLEAGGRIILTARDDEARIQMTLDGTTKRSRIKLWEEASIRGPASLSFWACTCGHLRCSERHRLESWDASQVTLWSFAASAVKGPQPSIQLGSFIAGMYFPLLAKEGFGLRLRVADVEYKVCQPCSSETAIRGDCGASQPDDPAQPEIRDYVVHDQYGTGLLIGEMSMTVSEVEKNYICIQYAEGNKVYIPADRIADLSPFAGSELPTAATLGASAPVEYEGTSCPKQGHVFDPKRSHKVTHERLIVVGDYPPPYRQQPRIRCKNRDAHYYAITGQAAPSDLTERWENLYQPLTSSDFSDFVEAKRALADRQHLKSRVEDLAADSPEPQEKYKPDERTFRRSLKTWLAASLDTSCPLCGDKPTKTRLSTIWERTFAVIAPFESFENQDESQVQSWGRCNGDSH